VTYLLDTDHLTLLQKQDGQEWAAIVGHVNRVGQENVAASVVSFHEQVFGCHAKINKLRRPADMVRWYRVMAELLDMYGAMPLVPFDDAAATVPGGLPGNLRIGTMDLRIAAIALSRKLVVVIRNAQDFSLVRGLTTEDWTR
jgi:tRNA(fMet)-specific endonuclease VapC